ncbi:hypothetical protein JCM3765_003802 [Sporobolomyces pararoseus]
MAPYQSLLPERKYKASSSGLPRLKPSSSSTSINNATPAPPQPLETTQLRVQEDVSSLDFGSLLGGRGNEHELGLLNDEEVPDFLVDQSMWTVGGRTPAKNGKERATWDYIDEDEGEDEDVDRIAQYDDSDGNLPHVCAPSTPIPSTSSAPISFPPRPIATPSFHHSPTQHGQALFDEQEPSMNGDYTSTSNRSESFARNYGEQEEDSTFTLERDRETTPSLLPAEIAAASIQQEQSSIELQEPGVQPEAEMEPEPAKIRQDIAEPDVVEAEVSISAEASTAMQEGFRMVDEETRDQYLRVDEEQIEENVEGKYEEEQVIEAEESDEEPSLVLAGPVDHQQVEEDESHRNTCDEESELPGKEHREAEKYEDGQGTTALSEDLERSESSRMEVQVPVKFADEAEGNLEESSPPRPEEGEQPEFGPSTQDTEVSIENQSEPSLVEASAVSQRSRPSLYETSLSRHSSSPDVDPISAILLSTTTLTHRPLPTFESNAANLGPRHSIGGSRPALGLAFDQQTQRRRHSVAAVVTSSEWNKRESGAKKQDREVGVEVNNHETSTFGETSVISESSITSLPAQHSQSTTSDAAPILDSVPSNPHTPPDENGAADSTNSSHRSQEHSSVPLSPLDNSIPLSPTSHDVSLEADITLPAMGAPLDFHRSIQEIGHSTPAKSYFRQKLSILPEVTEARPVQPKGGRFDIETIQEVTEEESSFEIIREQSAQPSQDVVKEEEKEAEEEEEEAEIAAQAVSKIVQSAEEAQDQATASSQSPNRTIPEPVEDLSPPEQNSQLKNAVDVDPSQSEERAPRSEGPASSETLPLPLPVDSIPSASDPHHTFPATSTSASSDLSQSRPTKRSVRVSLAPPLAVVPLKTFRRASTSMIDSTSSAAMVQSRREQEKRQVRVSLAAPLPSAAGTFKKPRVSRITATSSGGTSSVEELQTKNDTSTQPVVKSLAEETPAIVPGHELQQLATTEESDQIVQDAVTEEQEEQEEHARPIAPAQICGSIAAEEPQPATSPNLPPAPLPASASSNKQAALTLPATFSFASTSTGLTREQERQKRKEDRERREKRVEEALKAKKQSMQRGSGWKKPEAKKDSTKRKAVENDRNVKRSRMDSSETGSATSRRPPLKTSTSSSFARKPPNSSRPVLPQLSSVTPAVSTIAQAPPPAPISHASAPSISSPALKLTKDTLEANRIATGPRIDLKRRISSFLESLEDDNGTEESQTADPSLSVEAESERVGEVAEKAEPDKVKAVPLAPKPPPPPPGGSRPPSRAQSDRSKTTSTRPISGPPKRKPLASSSTTTAKPFTFAAPRAPRNAPPTAPSSNASTASPMFHERLSAWKAREKEAFGKGKRKGPVPPPPMPLRTKNVQSAPPARLTNTSSSTSTSAQPPAKRPRVASAPSEQGRGGKENANSQRSTKPVAKELPVQKKPEKPIVKVIGGGVAEEMEKRLKEKLEWSERQKRREEEVRKRKEAQRVEEAESERKKLQALRAALTVDRRPGPVRVGSSTVGRSGPVKRS